LLVGFDDDDTGVVADLGGIRPKRWRVSITVTTLPRRLMMPST
jgi:hypothetical protein